MTGLLRRWMLAGWVLASLGPAWGQTVDRPVRLLVSVEGLGVAPWFTQFLGRLRTELRGGQREIKIDMETFLQGGGAPAWDGVVPDWLALRYAHKHYDFVVAGSGDFVHTMVHLRDRLWPGAVVVVPIANAMMQASLQGVPNVVGLTPTDAPQVTLSLIPRLRPQTRHVAVIAQTLWNDRYRGDWRRSLAALPRHVGLIDLTGLGISQIRERVRALPEDAVVFFAGPAIEMSGGDVPRDVVAELVTLSPVPVLVDASTMMGTGVLGGAVVDPDAAARDVARLIRLLQAGATPQTIGFQPASAPHTVFDWAAMQRWGIADARLPPGSVVLGRPPGLWEAYRAQVIIGMAVVVLQAALIGALLVEQRRRRRAERRSMQHLAELARLNRGAALGALSAALAHEINQPLGAILSNAETAELLMAASEEAPWPALRELMTAIRADDRRAADVLQRLRAWIGNTPGELVPTDVNPLIATVAQMLSTELTIRETELQLALGPDLPAVMADSVQIQQVVLNLVLNALDALHCVPARQRRVIISTGLDLQGRVIVTVCDNGPGLGGVPAERLFEPFFTTKPQGLGVGLAISRSIVERHCGRLWVEEEALGTCFRFSLPPAARGAVVGAGA